MRLLGSSASAEFAPSSANAVASQPILALMRVVLIAGATSSHFHHSAPDRDRYRVRPIVRLQLAHEILDMEIHGCFRDLQPGSDFLVLRAIANQPQDIQLAGG